MNITNVAQAKAQLSRLIDQALEDNEVVIGRYGKPVVKLVPIGKSTADHDMTVRIWQGPVRMSDDFDELPTELLDDVYIACAQRTENGVGLARAA